MAGNVRIIPKKKIKISKGWGGVLKYDFRCPKCGEVLSSSNEQALLEDNCPTCSTTFVFDEEVQAFWKKYRNQQRQDEEIKKQEQASKQQKAKAKRIAAAQQTNRIATSAVGAVRSQFDAVRNTQFASSTSILDIFDWRFKKYLTPWILRVTWLIVLFVAALWVIYQLFNFLAAWLPEVRWDTGMNVTDLADARNREPAAEPMLPFWFKIRLFNSLLAITKIAVTAIVMLWIRVAFEMAIVLFNIATTLTGIENQIKDYSRSAESLPE